VINNLASSFEWMVSSAAMWLGHLIINNWASIIVTLLGTLVGTILGGVVSIGISQIYSKKASAELREQVDRLMEVNKFWVNNIDGIMVNRDIKSYWHPELDKPIRIIDETEKTQIIEVDIGQIEE